MDDEAKDPVAEAKRLRAEGYTQVSNKYRSVARLPAGMTGLQALDEVDPSRARDLRNRIEDWAADEYKRIYARADGLVLELDEETFKAFKRQGYP